MDVAKLPIELGVIILGNLPHETRSGFVHLLELRLVSQQWRKLVSRLAVRLRLRTPQTSVNILKLTKLFPAAISLTFHPQEIFDYDVLHGFRLQTLTLLSLSSHEALCKLPSSINTLSIFAGPYCPKGILLAPTEQMLSSVSSSLTKLSFSCEQRCHDVPVHLFTNLTDLSWNCSCYKNLPPLDWLSTLTNLVALKSVAKLPVEALSALTKLEHLELQQEIPPPQLHCLPALTYLDVMDCGTGVVENKKEALVSLAKRLPNLKILGSSLHQVTHDQEVLFLFTGLTHLLLIPPVAEALLPQLSALKHITRLFTPTNSENGSSILPYLTPSARSLRSLRLHHRQNDLQDCDVDQIMLFKNLTSLTLRFAKVSQSMLDRICVALCGSLEELVVSHETRITSLESVALCSRLRRLDVQSCGLLGSDELAHLTAFENLSFLSISSIPNVKLSPLKNAKFRDVITVLIWHCKSRLYTDDDIEAISAFKNVSVLALHSNLTMHQIRQLLWNIRVENLEMEIDEISAVETLIACALEARRPIYHFLCFLCIKTRFDDLAKYPSMWTKLCEFPALTRLEVQGEFMSKEAKRALEEKCQRPNFFVAFTASKRGL